MLIKTSLFHQGFTLLGRSSIAFTVILLLFYSTSFWFSYNAAHFGIPAILFCLFFTHYLLIALESKLSCKFFSFIFKGKPPVIYHKWLNLEENRIVFGIYPLLYSAIASVSLSPFGNIIFKSFALTGIPTNKDALPSNTVLKLPISSLSFEKQKEFIRALKEKCPQSTFSPSLEAILSKPILKSTNYIHLLTLIIFFIVLLDIGHSTFKYIELLKRYYLSQRSGNEQNINQAKQNYDSAESLRNHCAEFSLIMPKLMNNSSTAAGLFESRSKALWEIGNTQEALATQIEATKLAPKSFKINLRLARLYFKLGQYEQAKNTLETVSERHKHALLPKLYTACLLLSEDKSQQAKTVLRNYLSSLDTDYFSIPPVWPPAGEDAIHELFVRDDLEFLLSRLESGPHQRLKVNNRRLK